MQREIENQVAEPLPWIAELKKGDKVMVFEGERFCKVSSFRCTFKNYVSVGNKMYRNSDASDRFGYRIKPFDAGAVRAYRQRDRLLKRLDATDWTVLPTETLLRVSALLEATP